MKRILIFILALCLLVPCFGCNKAEAPEVAPSAEPTVEPPIEVSIKPSEEVSEEPTREPTYYPGVGEITPDILEDINKDKVVCEDGYENEIILQYGLSEESEKIILEFCEENVAGTNDTITQKTYVYPIEPLENRFIANHDHGEDRDSKANRWMQNFLDAFPTEAIRKSDEGIICTIYDTAEKVRLFVWYAEMDKSVYEQLGYVIYMAETLSYRDFNGIEIGDNASKVESIDSQVVGIHLKFHRKYCSLEQTQSAIQNGVPPRSLHLLTDGLLIITYGRDEDGFFVTDIEFNEDFMIDTVAGPQCCKINPLDYVTQG